MKVTIVIPNREPFPLTVDTDEYIHYQGGILATYNNSPYHTVAENINSFDLLINDSGQIIIIIPDREPFPLEVDVFGSVVFADNTIFLRGETGHTVIAENITTFEVEYY